MAVNFVVTSHTHAQNIKSVRTGNNPEDYFDFVSSFFKMKHSPPLLLLFGSYSPTASNILKNEAFSVIIFDSHLFELSFYDRMIILKIFH